VALALEAEPVPLAADASGVLRVGGTRVTFDTVVGAFTAGATPEEIVLRYDALRLEDVYLVLGYYLRHQSEMDQYLAARRQRGEQHRTVAESKTPWAAVRERLQARAKLTNVAPRSG
jgi:uncharacterized protein (DUF433 family)